MRKLGFFVLLVMAAIGLLVTPTLAQAVAVCANVHLTAPADGAALDPDYETHFRWDAEPRGTASRDWVSVRIDSTNKGKVSVTDGVHAKADKGNYRAYARGADGVYIWFVVFKDAKGHVICMSEQRTYIVGAYSAEGTINNSSVVAAAKASLGRYVVHLMGYKFTDNTTGYAGGTANWEKAGDTYDDATDAVGAHDWKALGYDGVDFWGNGDTNIIVGSDKDDKIYGLGGSDVLSGGKGNDTINGGDESCFALCAVGDLISGGDGDDTINGGNESCTALCSAGDTISGGDGNDTINGGDESCGAFCSAGDDIHGDNGNDTINGGKGDDTLNGDAGNDTINGGDGNDNVRGGSGADTLHGNAGNDTVNTGGNDGAHDTGSGDAGNDNIQNGPGDSVTQN